MVIRKQRDGVAGVEIPFEAETVELGLDEDGDPITAQVLNFGEPEWPSRPASSTTMIGCKAVEMSQRRDSIPLPPRGWSHNRRVREGGARGVL